MDADDAVEHADALELADETAGGDLVDDLDVGRVVGAAVAAVAEQVDAGPCKWELKTIGLAYASWRWASSRKAEKDARART